MEPITVTCRRGVFPGVRHERVAAYDFEIDGGSERSYLLLDEHVQLRQPRRWASFAPGGWYVDLVDIAESGSRIAVADWWIDVIVPTSGPYRVIDLEEYAAAIREGALSAAQAALGLERLQAFLDRHLHRPQESASPWRDFPPRALAPLLPPGS